MDDSLKTLVKLKYNIPGKIRKDWSADGIPFELLAIWGFQILELVKKSDYRLSQTITSIYNEGIKYKDREQLIIIIKYSTVFVPEELNYESIFLNNLIDLLYQHEKDLEYAK